MEISPEQTPDITYPCHWEYRLVGRKQNEMEEAVRRLLPSRDYTLKPGNRSAKGTFISLHLSVLVFNHNDRRFLYDQLKNEPVFMHVL